MTPRDEILTFHVGTDGWAILPTTWPHDRNRLTLYRWKNEPLVRVEVTVIFDKLGRVHSWSEWHNTRVGYPDGESGRRDRLIDRLEER